MSFKAIETLVVRGNEIGFTGVVQPGTFSRYCEWARWALFRTPEVREGLKFGGGVARAQRLELLHDVTYPATLRIETTLARLGRTSLDMLHTLHRIEDAVVVARSRITIVQLGPDGPSAIDPGAAAYVTPEEGPEPLVYEAGEVEFETNFLPRPSDQDQFRHVNQAKYVDLADDLRHLAATAGHPSGFDGALGGVSVDYRREVKAGTLIRAELRRGSGTTRSVRFVEAATGVETTRLVLVPR